MRPQEREPPVRDGVDEAANEVGAPGDQPVVLTPERDDPHFGVRAFETRDSIRVESRAGDQVPGSKAATRRLNEEPAFVLAQSAKLGIRPDLSARGRRQL